MRGEDRTRCLGRVGREVEGRKEEREGRKEKAVLPGVMEFIHAVCLRLSFVQ